MPQITDSQCPCGQPSGPATMRTTFDGVRYHWNCAGDMLAGREIGSTRSRLGALRDRLACGSESISDMRDGLIALLDEALQR